VGPSPSLQPLLAELAKASSPLDKLRYLALAWRTLRELSPTERADLATRLGLEGAEGLVEKLAVRKGGVGPSELLEAVHAARQADPAKLRQLLAGLRSAEGRRAALAEGVSALEQQLIGEGDEEPLFEALVEDLAAPAAMQRTPAAVPAGDRRPGPLAPGEEQPIALPVAPAAPPPKPPVAPTPPGPRPRTPVTAQPSATVHLAAPPSPAAPEPSPAPHASPAVPGDTVDRLVASLASTRSLATRLRRLSAATAELGSLPGDQLRRLVEAFPRGWARRRAVTTLLKAEVPRSLALAIDLVAGLERERDRAWCLATLLATRRGVDSGLLECALGCVSSPAARRRLERLAGAAR